MCLRNRTEEETGLTEAGHGLYTHCMPDYCGGTLTKMHTCFRILVFRFAFVARFSSLTSKLICGFYFLSGSLHGIDLQ